LFRGCRLTGPFTYDFEIHNPQTSNLELVDLEPRDTCPADHESTDRQCAQRRRTNG
jgi:hypothetical protein